VRREAGRLWRRVQRASADPAFLAYHQALVGRHVGEHLGVPGGPENFEPVHGLCVAETEVQHRGRTREVARAPSDLACLGTVPHVRCDDGAQGIAVALGAFEIHREPVARRSPAHQEHRGAVAVLDHEIEPPVPVEIRDRNPPAILDPVGAGQVADIDELAIPLVPEQNVALIAVYRLVADVGRRARLAPVV